MKIHGDEFYRNRDTSKSSVLQQQQTRIQVAKLANNIDPVTSREHIMHQIPVASAELFDLQEQV